MNCFNHSERPAVGLCKSCGKALCKDCISEVPHGLACKDACEDRVKFINCIIDSNKQALTAANVQVKSGTAFMIVLGIVFCLFGFLPLIISGQKGTIFLGVMGIVFLVTGLLRLHSKNRYPEV